MPIIAIIGQKGGTGKSTVAVCLAAELHGRGLRVLLGDADRQGSSLGWGAAAVEAGISAPETVRLDPGFENGLPKRAASYDWTILDTPPHADDPKKLIRGALVSSDLALMPCGPGAFEAWALGDTLAMVESAKRVRPDLRGAVLLTRVTRTTLGKSAREVLEADGASVLRSELGLRVAYVEAASTGRGPSGAAGEEIHALADELLGLFKSPSRSRKK